MSLDAQRQIRENVDEAQSFLRDLRQWQKDIKDSTTSSSHTAAPMRAAVEEGDADQAEKLRKRGNDFFGRGEYKKAAELYTQSLDVCATSLGYSNRAMAYLKLKDALKAESDCTAALEFDGTNVKTYQRRSLARHLQGNLTGALEDAQSALRLNPESSILRSTFLERLEDVVSKEELKLSRRKSLTVAMDPPLQSIDVPIGTGDGIARIKSITATKNSKTSKHAIAKSSSLGEADAKPSEMLPVNGRQWSCIGPRREGDADDGRAEAAEKLPVASKQSETLPMDVQEVATFRLEADEKLDADRFHGLPNGVSSIDHSAPEAAEQLPPIISPIHTIRTAPPKKEAAEKVSNSQRRPSVHPIPKTWASFEAGYKSLRHDPKAFADYLIRIDGDALSSLFKSSLSPPILAKMLEAVLHDMNDQSAERWLEFLEGAKKVPRYDLLRMCFDAGTKMKLKEKWSSVSERLPTNTRTRLETFFNR